LTTLSDLVTEINTQLPTNATGQITAAKVRTVLIDMATEILADVASGGGGSITVEGDPGLTLTSATTTFFATPPAVLRTSGYYTPGDEGGASYMKVATFTTPVNALGQNVGCFTTGDGTKYQMMFEGGQVYVNAFGAQSQNAFDYTHDQWQFFEDCKWFILGLTNVGAGGGASSAGGATMRIGRGYYYLTKPHSMEGGGYTIKGCGIMSGGTTWRTPENVSAIIIQHNYGGDTTTIGQDGYPLNGSPTTIGLSTYVSGAAPLYKTTNVGTPNMSSPPTGTGTGIVSGTAHFDFIRNRTWSEMLGGGAHDSTVQDITFWSRWDKAGGNYYEDQTIVDGSYQSAIIMRTRADVRNVNIVAYPGFGIAAVADGDPLLRGAGNCNGFVIDRVHPYYCGHAGVHIGLSDSNAGTTYDVDTAHNGQAGIQDWSFLGNVHVNPQMAFDGNKDQGVGKWYPGVTYGGYYWQARSQLIGADPAPNYANTPGTDQYSWMRVGGNGSSTASSLYPNWSAANASQYAVCAAMETNNINSANTVIRIYVELGTPAAQFGPQDFIVNVASGSAVAASRNPFILANGLWTKQMTFAPQFSFDDGIKEMHVNVGGRNIDGGNPTNAPDNTLLSYSDWSNNQMRLFLEGATPRAASGLDMKFRDLGFDAYDIFGVTAPDTAHQFGTGVAVPRTFFVKNILIGDGGGLGGQFVTLQCATSNITGTSVASGVPDGSIIIYKGATSGQPWGFQACGGTWVALTK
jgi:hypothetical protein